MRQRERVRGGAEQAREQSRLGSWWSWSHTPSSSQSPLRTPDEASQVPIKLNRQIPELETVLSLRKQRTVNCSNRQKIQFCKVQISIQELFDPARTRSLTEVSNRRISNREPTMQRASASRASALQRATQGICSGLSNRELLGLGISQLVENKHPRPILIANFEP